MEQIYRMQTAEAVGESVDYDVIQTLKNSVGEMRYQEIAEEAAFKLADRLGRLERAMRDKDYTLCYRHSLNICGISSQIGLIGVSKVATSAMECAREEDMAALGAVVSRLNRLAEGSLFSIFADDM